MNEHNNILSAVLLPSKQHLNTFSVDSEQDQTTRDLRQTDFVDTVVWWIQEMISTWDLNYRGRLRRFQVDLFSLSERRQRMDCWIQTTDYRHGFNFPFRISDSTSMQQASRSSSKKGYRRLIISGYRSQLQWTHLKVSVIAFQNHMNWLSISYVVIQPTTAN